MFIVLEGIDASGKSTQAKLLNEYYLSKGYKSIYTKEPGGCEISNKIREILVQGTPDTLDYITELLLVNASRREHIKQTIKPALDEQTIVICDRFIDSTLAYQHMVGEEVILGFHKELCFNLFPDFTFYIDIDPTIAFLRGHNQIESRFEQKGLLFMINVRDKFLERANKNKGLFGSHFILNGEKSIEELHEEIKTILY
ncbi:MAG: dTMP kinase [Magnetococcus sp. YQC-3]